MQAKNRGHTQASVASYWSDLHAELHTNLVLERR
jgi:hypothetical protein